MTVKAQWQINQYTITFDTDGGSEIAPITQDYASAVTAPANPTKTGYTFKGWDKDIPSTMPAEDVAVKATWEINQYTVKFVDGETEVKSETLDYGSAITAPEAPVKEGYTFKGWSSEVAETVPAEDVTYTAVWQINQYTITFDTDGGSEVAAITQDYASAVTAPADPTKTGYTFKGWDKEIPATMPAEDVAVKATWEINQYTVKFVDGETEVKSETLDYGSAITAPEAPVKEGYTFKGWSSEVAETVPAEDVTYTAVWQINQYTITFDTDGGSEVAAITQDYASAVTAPADPTKTGYTFKGWDKEIPATIPAEDMTIKATWQINQYTITFDTDGGSEVAAITQDYASAVTAPADPTKTGYTFKGWDKEIPATIPAEDMTIKATWQINQYTITFDTDGGSEIAPITQDYASAVTAPSNPTKTGYSFAGWDKEIPSTMPAENVTVKATWTINQYTVKFVADGEVVSESVLDYGTAITAPEAPVREGYTFKGWTPDVDETVPANDVEYVAEYTINTYKLTYVLDEVEVKTVDVEYGAEIEDFVPEVGDGREFAGWVDVPATMPAHDVTIYGSTKISSFISVHFANSNESITVYTLNGMRVMTLEKASDMQRLTRGTYIINGRKVVIRK